MITLILTLVLFSSTTASPRLAENRDRTWYCESEQCLPSFTEKPNLNAALKGYNPLLGNRFLEGKADPGLKNQIFVSMYQDEDSNLMIRHSFIDDPRGGTHCEVASETEAIRSYQDYQSRRSEDITNHESVMAGLGAKGSGPCGESVLVWKLNILTREVQRDDHNSPKRKTFSRNPGEKFI